MFNLYSQQSLHTSKPSSFFLSTFYFLLFTSYFILAQDRSQLFSPEAVDAGEIAEIARPQVLQKIEEQIQDLTIRRNRFVRSGYHHFFEEGSALHSKELLELNLFEGLTFAAVKESEERRGEGEFTWIGRIVGARHSQAVLVVNNDDVTGNIWIGEQLYQVRPIGDGIHTINEIDQSAFPQELPPLEAQLPEEDISPNPVPYSPESTVYIDVMVVYSPAAASASTDIEQEIQLAIDEANTSYANSGISQRLRLVHTAQITYTESGNISTDLSRLRSTSDGYMDDVHLWRDSYGADLVNLWVETGGCGIAYIMETVGSSFASWAFSVAGRSCATGNLTFPHELGHNMSARHDWYVDGANNSPYTYNHGYTNAAEAWRTIMAYENACIDLGGFCTRLPYWSNPDTDHPLTASAMGVPEGSPNASDNRKTLNNTASTIAAFRIALTAYLYADPMEAKLSYFAGMKEIAVSNIGSGIMNWTAVVTSGNSWLTITSGSSGFGDENIQITYTENSAASDRQGTIQIASPEAVNSPIEVTVTQFGEQQFAILPYSTGFESGSLDAYWRTYSDQANGRIQVTTANSPHSGSYHLTMDVTTSGLYVTNEAWLHLDLSGNQNVDLKFWWKDTGDETQFRDGVYFSDDAGETFVRILDLLPYAFNGWTEYTLDLDSLTAARGKSLTATSVIKFQQYDNFPMTSDGFAFDDISVVNADVKLYAKAWLEGPYRVSGDTMSTYMARNDLLPLSQPFGGAPWNYSGAESVASIPNGVVDWLLIELRSMLTEVATGDTQVAFIKKDGSVVALDGASPLKFGLKNGSYYIVLYHRNHLAIMSSDAEALSKSSAATYDFSTGQDRAYGSQPMKKLENGVFGMRSGDANADGSVNLSDRESLWRPQNGTAWDYLKAGDFNLDGGIDASDLDLHWRSNQGKSTQVP